MPKFSLQNQINRKKQTINRIDWLIGPSIILGIILLAIAVMVFAGDGTKGELSYPKGPELASSDRILLIAPHPDDESLGCAGIIQRAVANNIPTKVVIMTAGDGYKRCVELFCKTINPDPENFRKLGAARHLESIKAMEGLGLAKKNIVFLCYPDGGIESLFNKDWDYDTLHQSSNGNAHAPYDFAYEERAPYCGESVVKNLEEIITNFKPNIILYPDPADSHHDHWATAAFIEYVLAKTNYRAKQLTYLVHKGFDWPSPWLYTPKRHLLPPDDLTGLDAQWMLFLLSQEEEEGKHIAVNTYLSQKDLIEPFLDAFVRKNELFARYPRVKATRVTREPDFFSGSTIPHIIINDRKKDTLIKELEGFGDLSSVALAIGKNDTWLALKTRRHIAKDLEYAFHLRIFKNRRIERADFEVQYGKAKSLLLAKNSVFIDAPIATQIKKNRLVIKIPATLLKNADTIMVNADTFNSHSAKRVDMTSWRTVQLK